MKITKSITIDLEVWLDFTKKVNYRSYSSTIEELVKAYNSTEDISVNKIQEQEIEIKRLQSKIAIIQSEKAKIEQEAEKTKKEQTRQEPLDKWEAARLKLAQERAKRYDN